MLFLWDRGVGHSTGLLDRDDAATDEDGLRSNCDATDGSEAFLRAEAMDEDPSYALIGNEDSCAAGVGASSSSSSSDESLS